MTSWHFVLYQSVQKLWRNKALSCFDRVKLLHLAMEFVKTSLCRISNKFEKSRAVQNLLHNASNRRANVIRGKNQNAVKKWTQNHPELMKNISYILDFDGTKILTREKQRTRQTIREVIETEKWSNNLNTRNHNYLKIDHIKHKKLLLQNV